MSAFTTGVAAAKKWSDPFGHLNLDQRRELCLEVLNEVGAQNIQEKGRHELYHSCVLPFGNHPNGDRNPSASVNYEKMVAGCYVCGNGGWLWWIAAVKGLETSIAARDWVAARAGDDRLQSTADILAFLDSLYTPTPHFEPPVPVYDESVLNPWLLVHPYLTEYRHVPLETILRLKVGYGRFSIHMGEGRFTQSDRIVIPHFFDGKLYGWQTRRLGDDGTPKYQSTPDMPKDSTLFDLKRGADRLVVVESPMTVLRHSHSADITATFGASVTDKQMDIIARSKAKRVVLWFDNDTAGWNATEHVGDYLVDRMTVWAVDNPFSGDPGDLTDAQFQSVYSNCVVPYALWKRPDHPEALWDYREVSDEEVRQRVGDPR